MQPLFFLQAAVATASGGGDTIPLGGWLAIISTAAVAITAIYKLGRLSANAENLKANTEKELADMRKNVNDTLAALTDRVDEILTFIHESQQQRISDARWQATTSGEVANACKDATDAKETAHRARNMAAEAAVTSGKALDAVNALDRRVSGVSDRRGTGT